VLQRATVKKNLLATEDFCVHNVAHMKPRKDCVIRARVPQLYKLAVQREAEARRLDESDITREALYEWAKRRRLIAA
jgi:hypothetical protein